MGTKHLYDHVTISALAGKGESLLLVSQGPLQGNQVDIGAHDVSQPGQRGGAGVRPRDRWR